MKKLGDYYTNFKRIDMDTRGGYARVSEVTSNRIDDKSNHFAFKLLRHEIDYQKGLERFEDEHLLMTSMSQDINAPSSITKIFDSGIVQSELSHSLHQENEPNPKLIIYSIGTDLEKFKKKENELRAKKPGKWLPYLVVELASYDDSLLRQIHHQPKNDPSGLYRLPTGEVIAMAIQLLDVMEYLHKTHGRAYMDWKPEHLFWNGRDKQVKLIDWNVTFPLKEGPGEKQNIRDDTRLFCGAALYISLTFVDPDNPTKPIGPRPTEEPQNPVQEIRRRYWTDNPHFYQRGSTLDDKIKQIIRKGLDPKQGYESPMELKEELIDYAKTELGASEAELAPNSVAESQYFKALAKMHTARHQFLQVQQNLLEIIESKGKNVEFSWLFETVKRALSNFPGS